jgi:N-carbamoylputrescine amidase
VRITTVQWDARDPTALWPQIATEDADLLVLPELGMAPWLPDTPDADPARWRMAVAQHEALIGRLDELRARVVVGSQPVVAQGRRYNQSFVWCDGELLGPVHRKTYLPDEEGYWEATWYQRGPVAFEAVDTPVGRLGIMLCTELWFLEHARALGAAGIDVLAVPRATPAASVAKWVAGGRTAAVVAGAYCVSANQSGTYQSAAMGGGSWIIDPEAGDLLALTDAAEPVTSVDADRQRARRAKGTYPRYVVE